MDIWFLRIHSLPDLRHLAEAEGGDRDEIMERLKWQHERSWTPYVWTSIFRSPPAPCSTGEHQVPAWEREIIRPGRVHRKILKIHERVLHEVEYHGAEFDADTIRELELMFPQV